MKPSAFLDQLDDARVVEAIHRAESTTTGEIRVFVSQRSLHGEDILQCAAARFRRLGMEDTPDRNGVLLYFLPREQKFAVLGDRGIHARSSSAFWAEVASAIAVELRRGQFTEAVLVGVKRVGDLLAEHFPGVPSQSLPDDVARD